MDENVLNILIYFMSICDCCIMNVGRLFDGIGWVIKWLDEWMCVMWLDVWYFCDYVFYVMNICVS